MARGAHRRIHLRERADALIGLVVENEMVGRHFDAGDVLVVGEERDFFRRGDMQHMHERALLPRDAQQALRRAQRGLFVAPDRMRGGVARDAKRLAFVEPLLVLAVEGGAAARVRENFGDARVICDEQRARRGAHEHLDPRRARQALEFAEISGVLMRAADPEGEVAMHPPGSARDLVGKLGLAAR